MPICSECGDDFLSDDPDAIIDVSGDEVFDLIAEAALVSPKAAQAYALLREANPAILPLEARLRMIEARRTSPNTKGTI